MVLPSITTVDFSRIQFAATALFHFLFAPLTLGLSWILVVMEALYVTTGKVIYRDMTQFWGKLFAINFAMGVVTGVTMEFEFGTNWAYFSKFIGDAFGTALAIEGLTAFMLEASLVGVFLMGWNRMGKYWHLLATFALAVGSNLSTFNILVANSWMQHPVHTYFNYRTMHLHLTSLWGMYTDQIAQIRIGHVAMAGAMVGTMFVLGISAFYLLKNRDVGFAKRSMAVACGFGLLAAMGSAFLGDQNGLAVAKYEPEKMAAIEAIWDQPKPPAAWNMIAFPSQKHMKNYFDIQIPYVLSIIATHSLDGTIPGVEQIMQKNKKRIQSGFIAYHALQNLRQGNVTPSNLNAFNQHKKDLGFGLLLKRYDPAMQSYTPSQLHKATKDTIPEVWVAFWSFRIMVACWSAMMLVLLFGCFFVLRDTVQRHRWWLYCALFALPLPWIAAEFGWVTAEMGRQPWVVRHVLPTFLGTSSINTATVVASLIGFVIFYTVLFCVEIYLMFKYARLGPSTLDVGRYYFENQEGQNRQG